MKIALAQINTTVGDFAGNVQKILDAAQRARFAGCRIVCFPELAVCGYPPRDLLASGAFISAGIEAMDAVREKVQGVCAIVGFVERPDRDDLNLLYNAAMVVEEGKILQVARKRLLPTYDIFDEARYFEPGDRSSSFELDGKRIALTICEDLWSDPSIFPVGRYGVDPVAELAESRPDLIFNLSASHFTLGKGSIRLELAKRAARMTGAAVAYCNLVGGNDEAIYDGAGFLVSPDGELAARGPAFVEDLIMIDLERSDSIHALAPQPETDGEAICKALEIGLADYMGKCGFTEAVVGLSGGIDSALTAALAVGALGADCLTGVAMPSRYSSEGSVEDARRLAENLGIAFHVLPIEIAHKAYENTLTELFAGTESGVAEENLQARIRGNLLMALSNKFGRILLTTGNKSELAVGYCTLYGDMAGGLAVISDLWKTQVYETSRAINRLAGREIIPEATLTKPPSAELKPDQRDTDSLPDYELLDPLLDAYIVRGENRKALVERGFELALVERVIGMVERNEYKRRQAPPGLKVTEKAFGIGRRIPIARKFNPIGAG